MLEIEQGSEGVATEVAKVLPWEIILRLQFDGAPLEETPLEEMFCCIESVR
jgi:hypothetical protein